MNESRKLQIDSPAGSRVRNRPAVGVPAERRSFSITNLGAEAIDALRRDRRKRIALAAAAVILVGAVACSFFGAGESPKFRTLAVMQGDLTIGPSATGMIEPVETVDVGAQIVGRIVSFGPDPNTGKSVDFCSRVKKGQLLANLDDGPTKAEEDKALANLKVAEAELARCVAREKQAQRDFQRAEELRDIEAEADYENTLAQRDISKADANMARAKVEQAKIALEQAGINRDYTKILSPVDGVVIRRYVNIGQTVVAGLSAPSLFLLAKDLKHVRLVVAVNEADIGDIKIGQKVTFTVDAFPDRVFSGVVSLVRYDATQQQNVVTYPVQVDVENADESLMPYMTPKLQFEVAHRDNAVLVPNQALRWQPTWEQVSPSARKDLTRPTAAATNSVQSGDEQTASEPTVDTGSPTVWVVAEDGLVRPVPVEAGLSDGMVTEIAGSAIRPGEAVVAGVEREAKADFVSAIVSKVTKDKK